VNTDAKSDYGGSAAPGERGAPPPAANAVAAGSPPSLEAELAAAGFEARELRKSLLGDTVRGAALDANGAICMFVKPGDLPVRVLRPRNDTEAAQARRFYATLAEPSPTEFTAVAPPTLVTPLAPESAAPISTISMLKSLNATLERVAAPSFGAGSQATFLVEAGHAKDIVDAHRVEMTPQLRREYAEWIAKSLLASAETLKKSAEVLVR
jgi:hypothetical protein